MNVNEKTLVLISIEYGINVFELIAFVSTIKWNNAFYIASCICQHFKLGPEWFNVREMIQEGRGESI